MIGGKFWNKGSHDIVSNGKWRGKFFKRSWNKGVQQAVKMRERIREDWKHGITRVIKEAWALKVEIPVICDFEIPATVYHQQQ